jgi:hypothetical protein
MFHKDCIQINNIMSLQTGWMIQQSQLQRYSELVSMPTFTKVLASLRLTMLNKLPGFKINFNKTHKGRSLQIWNSS